MAKTNNIIIDIMENWSFILVNLGVFLVSAFIIVVTLVYYSRTKHQGLIFIIIAESLSLGWSIINLMTWLFILPIIREDVFLDTIPQLMNLISLFFRVLWGLLFILGLSRLVQDLSPQHLPRS